jgi:DNA-directed RNA polymerase subunit M/transcription elongation factor TFIIS
MDIASLTINATALSVKVFYTKDYNDLRRMKSILISDALGNSELYAKLPYNEKTKYIMIIENSCLNETIRKAQEYNIRCEWGEYQFEQIYHSICYNILCVLNPELDTGSWELLDCIFNNKIDINRLAHFSCKELCPKKYEELAERIEKRANIEDTVKYTELYFCRKCKRNKSTVQRVQNRSNDEGSSFYITCVFCHNKWFGG